jgi:hypothetical protein
MRDLAWPSVKLFAPETGAPGFGGLFGVFTAGVLASRFAGWATATAADEASRATMAAIATKECMILFSY